VFVTTKSKEGVPVAARQYLTEAPWSSKPNSVLVCVQVLCHMNMYWPKLTLWQPH